MVRGVRIVVLLALALVAAPASAQALTLKADRSELGWIRLSVADAGDATHVSVAEQAGQTQTPVADGVPVNGEAVFRRAAAWRCDRLTRQFAASASYPDGTTQTATTSIATPSCKKRFSFRVTDRRARATVRVADRWKLGGVSVSGCVRAPGHRQACRDIALPAGRPTAARTYRARAAGLWTVSAASRYGQHVATSFFVRPRGTLHLLATGDSMIQIVDSYLKDRLAKRNVAVRSDARISTGLSKPFLLNWPNHAKAQARAFRPDVTVVFIGANDGFPFGSVDCCGTAWVDAYAKRVRAMMSAYSRGGRGLVYWLTLPAPRPAQWRPIYPAVNRAIKRAAASFDGAVRVLDVAKTFTPGYRFRQSMTWQGRRESVRQPDGVHLSPPGASIAATLIQRALARDGAL